MTLYTSVYANITDTAYLAHFCLQKSNKVGCVFSMVVNSILPHAEFGRNDHREDVPHYKIRPLP